MRLKKTVNVQCGSTENLRCQFRGSWKGVSCDRWPFPRRRACRSTSSWFGPNSCAPRSRNHASDRLSYDLTSTKSWYLQGHLGDVKGRVDGALAARNGSGQHETVRGEGRLEFTQQADEIFLCVKLMEWKWAWLRIGCIVASTLYLVLRSTSAVGRILPVHIETIECVFQQKIDGRLDEHGTRSWRASHLEIHQTVITFRQLLSIEVLHALPWKSPPILHSIHRWQRVPSDSGSGAWGRRNGPWHPCPSCRRRRSRGRAASLYCQCLARRNHRRSACTGRGRCSRRRIFRRRDDRRPRCHSSRPSHVHWLHLDKETRRACSSNSIATQVDLLVTFESGCGLNRGYQSQRY